jgi:hypothetical protein
MFIRDHLKTDRKPRSALKQLLWGRDTLMAPAMTIELPPGNRLQHPPQDFLFSRMLQNPHPERCFMLGANP